MRRSPVHVWLHVLRALLLLGTLWAAFTVWVFRARPDWVRAVGEMAVAAHVDPWTSRLAAAQAVAEYAEVADALAGYRAGDRLGEVRRRALDALVEHLLRAGEPGAAAAASAELVRFDPRDVAVRIRHGELLASVPERSAEGLTALHELHELLPADPRVAVATAKVFFARGRAGEAMAVLETRANAVQPGEWLVDWGTDFLSQGFVTPLRAGDRLELRFELPPGVGEVRLSLPPYCSLRLHEPVLVVTAGDRRVEVPVADLAPAVAGGAIRGSTAVLHGEVAGAIRMRLPDALRGSSLQCALVSEVSEGQPRAVLELLLDSATREALAESGLPVGSAGERLLHDARLLALAGGRVQVFWRDADAENAGAFAGSRSSAAMLDGRLETGRLGFSVELSVDARATHLRIDLPEGAGHVYRLDELQCLTADGELDLDPAALEPLEMHAVELQDAGFRVTGDDPWLSFALPDATVVRRVRIGGEAR